MAAGERYKIRVKGYYTLTSPVYILAKANTGNIGWPGTSLAASAVTESWAEQTIIIPTGATQLQVGISWDAVSSTPKAYVNEIELIQLTTNATPEYQYNLKDHLGNIRLTFTTKDEADNSLATMEDDRADIESGQFSNYDEAVRIKGFLFDHTKDANDPVDVDNPDPNAPDPNGYALRLNGSANERYGLAKSLSVMPGDVISMNVFGKYLDGNQSNWTTAFQTLIASLAPGQPNAGLVIDGGATGSLGNMPFPYPSLLERDDDNGTGPKAYLNWLVFDRDFKYLDGGFKRLSEGAKESGHNTAHEALSYDLTVKEPGYVYIYLSNESDSPVEVYFDDFSVEHMKSRVIQTQDYYPFGLTYNSYQRENSVKNRFKFQGQEHIDALDLGWDSFKWRNHQPDIGRFFNVDPLAAKYYYNSPYAFSENKVVAHRELEGLEAQTIKQVSDRVTDKSNWQELGRGFKQMGKDFLKNTGLKAVWDGITKVEKSIPREKDKPKDVDGYTVTIVDNSNKSAPNEEHLPNGGKDKNSVIEKEFVDGMLSVPGRKYGGAGQEIGKGRPAFDETVTDVVGSAADAYNTGKDLFKPKLEGDTLHNEPGEAPPFVGENGQRTKQISDTTSILIKKW